MDRAPVGAQAARPLERRIHASRGPPEGRRRPTIAVQRGRRRKENGNQPVTCVAEGRRVVCEGDEKIVALANLRFSPPFALKATIWIERLAVGSRRSRDAAQAHARKVGSRECPQLLRR